MEKDHPNHHQLSEIQIQIKDNQDEQHQQHKQQIQKKSMTKIKDKHQTRQELLSQIATLSEQNKKLQHRIALFQPFKQRVLKFPSVHKIKQLFQDYQSRKVALKIAYIGQSYDGLVVQSDTSNTIQSYLLNVLYSLSLIPEKASGPSFSRAGRTDRGVSAMGNVIALHLRTSIKKGEDSVNNMNYSKMINNLLPEDIRVLGFKEVDEDFNARHMCTQRCYKYFFAKKNLDLQAMKQAIKMFIGKHNFSNFCKIDIQNTVNYERTITEASIHKIAHKEEFDDLDERNSIYFFYFKANSFLWHQIRYMVSILFLVGSKQQKPTIVQDLLNLSKFPRKPNYAPASENSLILEDCSYQGLQFESDIQIIRQFYNTFHEMVMRKSVQKTLLINCMVMAQRQFIKSAQTTHEQFIKGAINNGIRMGNSKKPLAVHKSSIKGVEELVQSLSGKKLDMYNKRIQKQNQYQQREKNKQRQQNDELQF